MTELILDFDAGDKKASFNQARNAKSSSQEIGKIKIKYFFGDNHVVGKLIATDGSGNNERLLAAAEGADIPTVSNLLKAEITGMVIKGKN